MGLMKINQAMEKLNCHRNVLYQLIARGDLQAIRIGKVYRVESESLEAFIERNRVQPKAQAQ